MPKQDIKGATVAVNERVAYFNGDIVPEEETRVSIWDAGVRSGEWVFESTRTFNHKCFRLRQHLERLYASMKVIDIDPRMTIDEMEDVTLDVLDRNLSTISANDDFMFSHDVSRGMSKPFNLGANDSYERTIIITYLPMGPFSHGYIDSLVNGVHAIIPPQQTIPARLLDPKMKNRNRIHYSKGSRQAARIDPKANAIFLDEDGFITEGGGANFLIIKGRDVISPEPRNILRGVTRGAVKDFTPGLGLNFVERNIEAYDVHTADEAFFTSTPYCVMPCVMLDGAPIADGKPGPITGELMGAFSEELGVDVIEQARQLSEPFMESPPKGTRPY